jgi:hypothetical protein
VNNKKLAILTFCMTQIAAAALAGELQNYSYSGSMDGYVQVALSPSGFGEGSFLARFSGIDETFEVSGKELYASGSIALTPATQTVEISGSGPESSETGSATLTLGINGVVSFQTTYRYAGYSEGNAVYVATLLIPVSATGVYNGTNFSASWSIEVPVAVGISKVNSKSLAFFQINFPGAAIAKEVVSGTDLMDGISDCSYDFNLSVVGDAVSSKPSPQQPAVKSMR